MRRLVDALLAVVPAAVLLLLVPLLLGAQPSADIPLDSGVKVRVLGRVTGGVPFVGRVIETRADTLVLADGVRAPLVVLARDLESVEVEQANRNRGGMVAAGALVGAVGGTVAAVNVCRGRGPGCWIIEIDGNDDGDYEDDEDSLLPSIGALTVGAIALVGAGIGAALTPSRWKRVGGYAAAPVRIGLQGARRGLGVAVSIPFGGPSDRARAAR